MTVENGSRYAACIEYCGERYSGWQFQKNASSVQEEVEKALSQVADHTVRVITAGRTDTGVHGIGQIVHFDSDSKRSEHAWIRGVNTHLPNDISLIWARPVDDSFHARFAALSRSYRYVILNRKMSPSYLHGRVTWHYPELDVARMQAASQSLIGTHDFTSFRAAGCQSKEPVKTVSRLEVNHSGPWIWIDITANGFLHHMVRNIAGVLMRIGENRESVDWAESVLTAKDRKVGGMTASPHGLYFVEVQYDDKFKLPPPPPVCCFW